MRIGPLNVLSRSLESIPEEHCNSEGDGLEMKGELISELSTLGGLMTENKPPK